MNGMSIPLPFFLFCAGGIVMMAGATPLGIFLWVAAFVAWIALR